MIYLDKFIRYLDQKGIRYTTDNEIKVRVSYRAENTNDISVTIIFDKDGEGKVHLVVWSIGNFSGSKVAAGIRACNALNAKFRWVKFYIDSDNEGCAVMDAIIDEETSGEECYELLCRMVGIVDDAYPELMRAMLS